MALATVLFFDGGVGQPRQVEKIVNWCGHSKDPVAWPEADAYWRRCRWGGRDVTRRKQTAAGSRSMSMDNRYRPKANTDEERRNKT